ncbi:MAG TPA: dihydroorotate dehydrogenase electron transfer subunit [Armatimonadota bacterium]|nr:dihydroorotate dehydrogenase electron transfer subunit [Armatimonadota bacterium]
MRDEISRVVADCEIIEQVEVAPHVFRSVLVEPTIARTSKPGQFVNVRVCECYDPLLRRPFSVHAVDPEKGTFSLLYDVIGRGTKLLMEMHIGEKVSVVGPLGSSFDVGEDPSARHILVAGGCGAAPIHFLSDWICKKHGCDKVTVLVGAKTGTALLCQAEFVAHGVEVKLATEDGSFGFKGFVTELLASHIEESKVKNPDSAIRIYACGPMPMMREVARVCGEQGIKSCQLSLERTMACGIGVCMGCVTKAQDGCCSHHPDEWHYSRVCTDGPVYDAKELVWE